MADHVKQSCEPNGSSSTRTEVIHFNGDHGLRRTQNELKKNSLQRQFAGNELINRKIDSKLRCTYHRQKLSFCNYNQMYLL